MKKGLIVVLALLLAAGMVFASPSRDRSPASGSAQQTELIVFAAASMTETLTEIQSLYAKTEPNVTLTFNFDSSGTLKTQIEEGADCDMFISAGQLQMNQLDIAASPSVNTGKLDFVRTETRLDLLENRVTLAVPDGNPANITKFSELPAAFSRADFLFAMGNSDVPVGQYTQSILKYFNLDESQLANSGRITYGSNVKEVTTQVKEASVSCGVIYCTDAASAALSIVDYATPEMCGRVVYPAAILKPSKNPDAALRFLNYLSGSEAMAVFEKVGFSKP